MGLNDYDNNNVVLKATLAITMLLMMAKMIMMMTRLTWRDRNQPIMRDVGVWREMKIKTKTVLTRNTSCNQAIAIQCLIHILELISTASNSCARTTDKITSIANTTTTNQTH
jgi:hypothetical protein